MANYHYRFRHVTRRDFRREIPHLLSSQDVLRRQSAVLGEKLITHLTAEPKEKVNWPAGALPSVSLAFCLPLEFETLHFRVISGKMDKILL